MVTKRPPADPLYLAQWRQIENLQPGHWFRVEYVNDTTGEHFHRWAEVVMRMSLKDPLSGQRFERIYAEDTAGYGVDFTQLRGFQVQRLTAAEGRRCGLEVPDEPTPTAEEETR